MNKNVRIFFITAVCLVLFMIGAYIKGHKERNNQQTNDFEASYKDTFLNGDEVEHLDSVSLIYSNFKYGFSMDFPDYWGIDRGVAEHTIIRGIQKDSAISFAVNVIELKDVPSDIGIWTLWDNKELGLEENYRNVLSKSVNAELYNFIPRKVYVSNREAIEIRFNFLFREVDAETEMMSLCYTFNIIPFVYTVGLHVPKVFYDMDQDRYDALINNFVIMKAIKK